MKIDRIVGAGGARPETVIQEDRAHPQTVILVAQGARRAPQPESAQTRVAYRFDLV